MEGEAVSDLLNAAKEVIDRASRRERHMGSLVIDYEISAEPIEALRKAVVAEMLAVDRKYNERMRLSHVLAFADSELSAIAHGFQPSSKDALLQIVSMLRGEQKKISEEVKP